MTPKCDTGIEESGNNCSSVDDVVARVMTYIQENLFLGPCDDLDRNSSLIEMGVLDSTAALELAAFLEREFSVVIADEELSPDNLDSLERIGRFVKRKQARAAGLASVA